MSVKGNKTTMSDQAPQEQTPKTINVFCANCQSETAHTGTVDLNGELVFTCTTEGCGRFIKVPASATAEEVQKHFADHKEANEGQVSIQGSFDLLDAVMTPTAAEDQEE